MQNLNPHGNPKEISREVKRELTPFEIEQAHPYKVYKIYEVENSNWNLFLLSEGYFLSVPKDEKSGCKTSVFGGMQHAEKYHEFINL